MTESITTDAKTTALSRLTLWADETKRRDPLVCDAKRAGATHDEIVFASGLAKQTVANILKAAGLTAEALKQQERSMQTDTTTPPAFGTSARFFPHHPHFVAVKPTWLDGRYEYTFREFTGDEPRPENPAYPGYVPDEEQTAEDKARMREYHERMAEIDSADKAWQQARYRRQITPLAEAAVKARPPVDEALSAMTEAWEALDSAPVWPVAVKRLIDAQDKARTEMGRWVDGYAYPLAKAEGSQSHYIREHVADWRDIAEKVTGTRIGWDIGWYYKGDHHVGSYSSDPWGELDETIRKQRARLEEITRLSGANAAPTGHRPAQS